MLEDDHIDIDDPQFRITPLQQAAASCTGAIITSFFVTPLDVIKIRLQAQQKTQQNKCFLYCNGLMDHLCGCTATNDINRQWYQRPSHFTGTIDAFVKISRNEGVASLWSGLSPTLVLAVPATIVYFVTYEQLRLKLKDVYNRRNLDGPQVQPHWIPLVAGPVARIFSTTIVSPLELIRTKMQSQRLSYFEIGEALKALVRQDGIRGLWLGVSSTLLRDVPFSGIYWMCYEAIKAMYGSNTPSFSTSFMAGAISGTIAATFTVPFDVVKTHQQIELGENTLYSDKPKKTQSTLEVIRQIVKQHGPRGLFVGLVPRLVKVAPACAIMISSFEYGKVFYSRLANQHTGIPSGAAGVVATVAVGDEREAVKELFVETYS